MTQQEFTSRYIYNPESDRLGAGAFGSVYKAYDNINDSYVALKISAVDPTHQELRLRNEVDKAHNLCHKNIARYETCYTFATLSGDIDVAVMRYYEDGSLDNFLRRGNLSYEERSNILTQLLEGIAYLHSHDIIHRDLKPQNVLMVHHAGRYIPKIADFGISKQLDSGESSLVNNSLLGGTRSYASPEQLRERALRKNTDLWSFGVIAYQVLTGELPFASSDASLSSEEQYAVQLRQIFNGELPAGIERIAEPWQSVIRACLVADNNQRVRHAEDCLRMIGVEVTVPIPHAKASESTNEATVIVGVDVVEKTIHQSADAERPASTAQQMVTPQGGASASDVTTKPKKKRGRGCLLAIIIFVIIALIGIFAADDEPKAKKEKAPETMVEFAEAMCAAAEARDVEKFEGLAKAYDEHAKELAKEENKEQFEKEMKEFAEWAEKNRNRDRLMKAEAIIEEVKSAQAKNEDEE